MKKAYVLLTAMPPTTGHLQLVRFADKLAENGVVVILCTQPFEPYAAERVKTFRAAIKTQGLKRVRLVHFSKAVPQDPSTPGFWPMWRKMLAGYGLTKDDYIVASESYGQKLAEITGAHFFPYDIERSLNPAKATLVRENTLEHFSDIITEFRPYLRTRITIFGAESTGKTTLSCLLAKKLYSPWLFEYARPYLENTINEITVRSMTGIWKGQKALQEHADDLTDSPYIIQDTDLFSTVGYWQFPHWQDQIGPCPDDLIADAIRLKSDLYIVTLSNIPFEKDPLRYGGDQREGSDEYWIDVCRRYGLPLVVLKEQSLGARLRHAREAIVGQARLKTATLAYDRHGF